VFAHGHVSMITYRVDVYQSRPIGASLLCLALKGCTHGLAGRGDAAWRHVATGCTVLVCLILGVF